MKNLKQQSILLLLLLLFAEFRTDSTLKQEGAENAIKWFPISQYDSDVAWIVTVIDVVKIGPVNQSSEKLASCTAIAEARVATGNPTRQCDYTETELTMDFYFEKNKNDKWVLRGIAKCASKIKVNEDNLKKFIEKNRNLNISVD